MIEQFEEFDGSWPYAPLFTDVSGFNQHYVDEGRRDGEVVLCLHGEPTWGYLYRKMIGPLSENFRVVVPDHMGFGKSETPQDRDYTLQTHVENLERFVNELDLRDITIVCQDWGGADCRCFYPQKSRACEAIVHDEHRTWLRRWAGGGGEDALV